MSATITMPSGFDEAVRMMCSDAVNQAVAALAAKYGFDAEEALREVNGGEVKLVRKRGPSPKRDTEKSVKKQKEKVADKPKRAPTGYLVFQKYIRPETVEEMTLLLEDGEKLKPQAVVKAIAAKWQDLSGEERAGWMTKAKRESNVPQPSPAEDGGVAEDDAVLVTSDVDMTEDE
jgi:hypothetical protein